MSYDRDPFTFRNTDPELRAIRAKVEELTQELAALPLVRADRDRQWQRAEQAEAKLAAVVGQVWPHMCRDGHEPLGFAGDDEMCPACKVMGTR